MSRCIDHLAAKYYSLYPMGMRGVLFSLAFGLGLLAAARADLLGPAQFYQGKHKKEGTPLSYEFKYLEPWGRGVADAGGLHYWHDRLAPGQISHDLNKIFPARFRGSYPLYYAGTPMNYQVVLRNNSRYNYTNLKIVAVQEYLDASNEWRQRSDPNFLRDWSLEELKAGEIIILNGEIHITESILSSGLHRTHIQVQHFNRGKGQPGPGNLLIEDAQTGIWSLKPLKR